MRSQWSRVFTSVLIASVMSSALAAQSLSVPDNLNVGQVAAIVYSDPTRAGQVVTVEITSGGLIPLTESITITLNENGVGAAGWTVPSWGKATFTAPNVVDEVRSIS